ncbi:MAG TPA: acetylglucosamine-6-sulfatase [Balneolaceae bacterium]|nr:acetylglucosamine-6-sulfatase [Balneolaceae bacterium]|tara:strand:- start:9761 stop:11224 length:1464 start_codon:yes stop_codon:yes gene_type:complete
MVKVVRHIFLVGFIALLTIQSGYAQKQKNIIFILSDDHRYDYMGFHENAPDFLQTPGMDKMAEEGAHISNAFVTTSLCSPSRASILTGQYAFRHGAVDNSNPIKEGTVYFPEFLQEAGYQTSFFGKWHIGEDDDMPKPGFDRWVSFRGQGVYNDPLLNFDGERKKIEGYTTDLLTDYAIDFIENRDKKKPFFVYLSHKAVHAEFYPAERHDDMYEDAELEIPASMNYTEQNYEGKPDWVKEQRFSWHGVDFMYHNRPDHPQTLEEIITEYSETLMGVDESVARVLDYLKANDLDDNTLVIYMGDNGFMLGEHGLIDKRQAYEESMRVPMIAWAPGYIEAGSTIDENILNIDLAPTFLDLAGGKMPADHVVDGTSFLNILEDGEAKEWRDTFTYQYFWEHAFPHTPTTYAIRGDRFKYIYYHGVWDKNELYDLKNDPMEMHNLINIPEYRPVVLRLEKQLFDMLEENEATNVRFRRPPNFSADQKKIH